MNLLEEYYVLKDKPESELTPDEMKFVIGVDWSIIFDEKSNDELKDIWNKIGRPLKKHQSFFDKGGNPIERWMWSLLQLDLDYKILAQEHTGDYFISTVWLGLNHGPFEGNIKIFETMIFYEGKEEDDPLSFDYEMERYSKQEEALEGHKKMKEKLEESIKCGKNLFREENESNVC